MNLRLSCIALAFVCLTLPLVAQTTNSTTTPATATVPRLIMFSGTLSHAATEAGENGIVLTPGAAPTQVVAITFSLYAEQTGGAPLWSEMQNVQVDSGGRYTVQLGASKPDGLPMDIFTSVQAQWLGVERQGQAEQPRVMVVSVPYALKAADAETFGGLPPSAYTLAPRSGTSLPTGSPTAVGNGSTQPNSPHPLPISGSGTTNYIPLWTNASTLASSAIFQNPTSGKIGIGTTTPQARFDVNDNNNSGSYVVSGTTTNDAEVGVAGQNLATSGSGVGTGGHTKGPTGIGIFGVHDSLTGAGMGVSGLTYSPAGVGVSGVANAPTGLAIGVSGASASSGGVGVFGLVTSTGSPGKNSFGVEGQAHDPDGAGGNFINSAVSGQAIGVGSFTGSQTGRAIYGIGVAASATGGTIGTTGPVGVWGDTGENPGVGVIGTADDGIAFAGLNNSTASPAGYFENENGAASATAAGVEGKSSSPTGTGVYGVASATTGGANGVEGVTSSPNGYGVWGLSTATTGHAYGVVGYSSTGAGVYGTSSGASGAGVSAFNTNTSSQEAQALYAVAASSNAAAGYFVNTGGGDILIGANGNGNHVFEVDVFGDGYFGGDLNVGGTLTKGGGSFKIDDPLDPANKYLYHSFVESPDMMNIYNGNVTTDKRGPATVVMPDYFGCAQS